MIYAVKAIGTSFIKFGYTSKDPKYRLSELQIGSPFHLELVAVCRGDQKAETWIHWRLFRAKAHHRGEWFNDCEEARIIIEEMKAEAIKSDCVPSDQVKIAESKRRRLGTVLNFATRKAGEWAN